MENLPQLYPSGSIPPGYEPVVKRIIGVWEFESPLSHVKKCSKCSVIKELSLFNKRGNVCKACQNEYTRQHYQDNKQAYKNKAVKNNNIYKKRNREYIIAYLRDHPCVDCGTTDVEVLQFDHNDPSEKLYDVSAMVTWSLKALTEEIAKCTVRCANDHTKRTRRQFGFWTDD